VQQDDDWSKFGSGRYSVQADTVILKEKFFVLDINQRRNGPDGIDVDLLCLATACKRMSGHSYIIGNRRVADLWLAIRSVDRTPELWVR
jgi:hypothetical protein